MNKINHLKDYLVDADVHDLLVELQSPYEEIRRKAHADLLKIGSKAIPMLIASLHDSNTRFACEAAQVLSEIEDPSSPHGLVLSLESDNPLIRWDASKELVNMSRGASVALLEALMDRPSSTHLRVEARNLFRIFKENNQLTPEEIHVYNQLVGEAPDTRVAISAREALEALFK